jgi:hypothetical protein
MSLAVQKSNYANSSYVNKVAFGAKVPTEDLVRTLGATCFWSAIDISKEPPAFDRIIKVCDAVTGGNAGKDGCLLAPDHCAARLLSGEPSVITSAIRLTIKSFREFFGKNCEIERTPEEAEKWVKWATRNFEKIPHSVNDPSSIEVLDPPVGGLGHEFLMQNPPDSYYRNLQAIDALPKAECNNIQELRQYTFDRIVAKILSLQS